MTGRGGASLDTTDLPFDLPSRAEAMASHTAGGGTVAAVFPVHYPRALFNAFGVLPVEVWGPPGRDTGPGDAHLQAYTCSIVRAGLAFMRSGGLDSVDLVVVPHACDSLQGLGSVLLDFLEPRQRVLTFYPPRTDGAAGLEYLAAEYRGLYERLAEATGRRPDDAALMEAIERDEAADLMLSRLLMERADVDLGDRQLYTVARSREYLPPEGFVAVAERALALRADSPRPGVPLVLSGVVPEPMGVLDAIEEAGGLVVGDDLISSGRRLYPRGRSDDPFRRLAERLLSAPPDSTRGSVTADRIRHLRQLVRGSDARAVLFHLVKFCEVELFYLPQIRKALEADGIKTVTIEVDLGDQLPHQAVTRLEALVETAA